MMTAQRDPFALARTEGDDLILSLFRQWYEEMRRLKCGSRSGLTRIALVVIGQIRRHSRIMRRKRSEGESAPMALGQRARGQGAADRVVQGVRASGGA